MRKLFTLLFLLLGLAGGQAWAASGTVQLSSVNPAYQGIVVNVNSSNCSALLDQAMAGGFQTVVISTGGSIYYHPFACSSSVLSPGSIVFGQMGTGAGVYQFVVSSITASGGISMDGLQAMVFSAVGPFDYTQAAALFSFFLSMPVACWFVAKNAGVVISAVRKF